MSDKILENVQNIRCVNSNVNIIPMFHVPPPKKETGLTFVDTAQPPPSAAEAVFSVPPPSSAEPVFSVPPPQVTVPPPSMTLLTAIPPPSLSVLPPVHAIPPPNVARPPPDMVHLPPNVGNSLLEAASLLTPASLPNQLPPPMPDFTRPPPFKRVKSEHASKYDQANIVNQYSHNDYDQQGYELNTSSFAQHNQYPDSQVYIPNVPPYYGSQKLHPYTNDVPNSSSYRDSSSSSISETAPRIYVRDFSKDRNSSRESLHGRDNERYRTSSLRRNESDRSSRRSDRDYTPDRYEVAHETLREPKNFLRRFEKCHERSRSHQSFEHKRERELEEKRVRYYEEREKKARRRDSEERHRRHPEQREREERRRRDSEERYRRHPDSQRERDKDRSNRYTEDRRRIRHTEERLREPEKRRIQEIEEKRFKNTEERKLQELEDRKLRKPEERRSMTVDRHRHAYSHAQSSRDISEASISSRDSRARRRSRDSPRSQRSASRQTSSGTPSEQRSMSDRDKILEMYRKNYCRTSAQIMEQIENLAKENSEEDEEGWYRSSPAELYYKALDCKGLVENSPKGMKLAEVFFEKLIESARKARPEVDELSPSVTKPKLHKHKQEPKESSSGESESENEDECIQKELQRKLKHPRRLHPEMWYNETGEMNDRPLCRCSARARRLGIRHGVFAGEKQFPLCISTQNNVDKLYHYRITVSPPTNFLIKTPTIISHDEHEFLFSGFSMFSHYKLETLPVCKVIRFNIEYTILYVEEQAPQNYTIQELDLFEEYLFREILELMDLDLGRRTEDKCSQFHFMPRFVRNLGEGGCEVLSMCEVLKYLLNEYKPLVPKEDLTEIHKMDHYRWQKFVDRIKGIIVTCPGKKPCSVRVDQLDRSPPENSDKESAGAYTNYPEIVHFGIRPPQLCYAGIPQYQKAWRNYVKFRHLIANMAKPTLNDRHVLQTKEAKLQEMRTQSKMKRDVTVAVSCEGFYCTGLMCDIVQHAMLIPVLVRHLRFHNSLNSLEKFIDYKFKNRSLLQLALTHPSFRDNFGTNPDHARNSLTNCGIRQPEYGDRQIHYMNTRKRGINTLIEIMSRFGKKRETESAIGHNERLEFLGDAVVEFLSTVHLFLMFPGLAEGGLATYRAAIVQNQHLALLAKKIGLEQYMLYTHGSDLCQELELRHAMANCFEALIAALYLDGDIEVANRVFSLSLWLDEPPLMEVWMRERAHPLQEQEPLGDRKYIKNFDILQKLTKFEESIGIQFKHIRLLARAFTDRSVGFTHLTLGSNQRLEFLGDTVLQLVVSDRLYRHFPEHHEGHLSLLRSSLVNNRTQSVVCDDLNMTYYAVYHNPKAEPSTKDKADLLEAFLGALFLDKGIEYCTAFCNACLFPRLQEFIMNQDWNDPKSKLQQCCLTLRTMAGGEPDVPIYKVIECLGPTNTRVYQVAVYFRNSRLASATGHSIQEAEMNAAKSALASSHELFPQLDHQKRVIAKSVNSHTPGHAKSNKTSDVPIDKPSSSNDQHKDSNKHCIQRLKKKLETSLKDRVPRAYKVGETAYSDESSVASSDTDADPGSDKEDSGHISGDSSDDA